MNPRLFLPYAGVWIEPGPLTQHRPANLLHINAWSEETIERTSVWVLFFEGSGKFSGSGYSAFENAIFLDSANLLRVARQNAEAWRLFQEPSVWALSQDVLGTYGFPHIDVRRLASQADPAHILRMVVWRELVEELGHAQDYIRMKQTLLREGRLALFKPSDAQQKSGPELLATSLLDSLEVAGFLREIIFSRDSVGMITALLHLDQQTHSDSEYRASSLLTKSLLANLGRQQIPAQLLKPNGGLDQAFLGRVRLFARSQFDQEFEWSPGGGMLPTLSEDGLRMEGSIPLYEDAVRYLLTLSTPKETPVKWTSHAILETVSWASISGLSLNVKSVMSFEQRRVPLGKRLYRAYMAVAKASSRGRPYFSSWDEVIRHVGLDHEKIRHYERQGFWDAEQVVKTIQQAATQGLALNVGSIVSKKQRQRSFGERLYHAYSAVDRGFPDFFSSWDHALRSAGFDPTTIRKTKGRPRKLLTSA